MKYLLKFGFALLLWLYAINATAQTYQYTLPYSSQTTNGGGTFGFILKMTVWINTNKTVTTRIEKTDGTPFQSGYAYLQKDSSGASSSYNLATVTYNGGSSVTLTSSQTLDTMGATWNNNDMQLYVRTEYSGGGYAYAGPITVRRTAATVCAYSISPTTRSHSANSETGSVSVTASTGCAWNASSGASWITISSGGSGMGNGAVNYTVAANTGTATRTGTLTVAGRTFTVTQAAPTASCATTTISLGQTINGALATTDCASTRRASYMDRYAFSGVAGQQISVTLSSSVVDPYLYLVTPNSVLSDDDGGGGTSSRIPATSGFYTLPVSGTYTLEVTSYATNATGNYALSLQTAAPCSYSLSPTTRSHSANSETGSVSVTASAGCPWNALSGASWITISSGGSGTGNGAVNYTVAANTGAVRAGTLTIAGQTFTVTQAAPTASCATTTISLGQTINSALATTDCRSTRRTSYMDRYAFSGVAGQQISVTLSSSVVDPYLYLVTPNSVLSDDDGGGGTSSRIPATSGFYTLPVSGTYTLEVTSYATNATGNYALSLQTAAPCSYSLSPTTRSHSANSETGSVSVTASAGCPWNALSGASWITISSGGSGTGNGAVNYAVAANTGTATRTGTLTIAGRTFTVTQAQPVINPPLTDTWYPPADGFDLPVQGALSATEWHVEPTRDFQWVNDQYVQNKYHLGEDWNWGSGSADLNKPIYAPLTVKWCISTAAPVGVGC